MSFSGCMESYFPLNSQFEQIRPVLGWFKLKNYKIKMDTTPFYLLNTKAAKKIIQ